MSLKRKATVVLVGTLVLLGSSCGESEQLQTAAPTQTTAARDAVPTATLIPSPDTTVLPAVDATRQGVPTLVPQAATSYSVAPTAKGAPIPTSVPNVQTPKSRDVPPRETSPSSRNLGGNGRSTGGRPSQGGGRVDELYGRYPCTEDGTKLFTELIFDPNRILAIEPMGKLNAVGGHVTPTDHLYVHRDPPAGTDTAYVMAPADGAIVRVQRFPEDQPYIAGDYSSPLVKDYRVVLMHSCTFFTIFIHLGDFAPAIAGKIGDLPLNSYWMAGGMRSGKAPIEVKAGEPIAKFGADSFDWSVHDTSTSLAGFVVPEHYEDEPWKIHTVDPFQFYDDVLRGSLLAKAAREVAPRAGKIDYDVEGTIVGNWFLDATVGYAGKGLDTRRYWEGHLAIAYGYIDPTQLRISIGRDFGIDRNLCNICMGAYGVRGNAPDPATVNQDSGLIKYELMSRDEVYSGNPTLLEKLRGKEGLGTTSLGTLLVEHLGERAIRVEVIPGKSPDDVPGFTDASVVYRR